MHFTYYPTSKSQKETSNWKCQHTSCATSATLCFQQPTLPANFHNIAMFHIHICITLQSSYLSLSKYKMYKYVLCHNAKVKAFPYSIPSVGPGADPGVQAVSLQVTVSHPHSGRLPLLSARPAVTSPAAEHHRPLAGTKLHCLLREARRCEQLAQGSYTALPWVGFEPTTHWSQVQRSTRCTTTPPIP